MNILFLGKFYPRTLVTTIAADSKGKAGMSNHNFEMSVINGLSQHRDIDLKCLTIPNIYSFPYNNRRLFTKRESYVYRNTHVCSVGFCNLPFIKEMWSTIALIVTILKTIPQYEGDRVDVIVNTPNNSLLNAIRFVKLFTCKIITQTVIIPDIPAMVTAMDKHNVVKSFLLEYLNRSSMRKTSRSNGVVLLTESMMEFIDRPVKHIVMEGIVDVDTMDLGISDDGLDKKIILYTGTLRKIFGVMNLVRAFQLLTDDTAELWICGSGDSQIAIEDAAKQDSRIKFFGLVDSYTALEMQRHATILVNPRTGEGAFTRYSFPSKTMEYLLSGKSTIINRLAGIPEEYYDYVFTPKDESIESLAECISNVLCMDVALRKKRAQSGRNFIITQKNAKVQTKRILDMINTY